MTDEDLHLHNKLRDEEAHVVDSHTEAGVGTEAETEAGAGEGGGGGGECAPTEPCDPLARLGELWEGGAKADGPAVLAPDHPLMARFQRTLKEYLLAQNAKAAEEIREMEAELRGTGAAREEAGGALYALQQDVALQQQALEKCHEELEALAGRRQEAEEAVEQQRVRRCEADQHLQWHQTQESSLREALRQALAQERQFDRWAEEMRAELAVSQRIAAKDKAHMHALTDEKRRQDAFLYKLTAEVANLRDQLADIAGKMTVKQREREAAGQAAADAKADLEALDAEQRRLAGAWRGVVALLGRRDRVYDGVGRERAALEEEVHQLKLEADGFKAAARREMDEGERVTAALTRLEADRDNKQHQAEALATRREELQRRLADSGALVKQTEGELAILVVEGLELERKVTNQRRELQRLLTEKKELETSSLEALSDQLRNDKAAQHMRLLATELRDRTRAQALLLVEAEHATAAVELAAARARGAIERNAALLKELRREDEAAARALDEARQQLERTNKTIAKRTSAALALANKLDTIVEKMGGEELNPLEARLVAVTADLRERETEVASTQAFWLRQQSHAVTLTQQRQDQLVRLDSLRKQVLILDHKNLKLEREAQRVMSATERLERSLQRLFARLAAADGELASRRGRHERADREALLASDAFAAQLRDAEEAAQALQMEVEGLEAERDERLAQLLEAQHEQLAWEKKLRVAESALEHVRAERAADGEMAAMRTEIHRMEVRRGQLARAQERLALDLEASVRRRANIADEAAVREGRAKHQQRGPAPTRQALRQRLEDLRGRLGRLRREAGALEKTLAVTRRRRAGLQANARARREAAAAALQAAGDAEGLARAKRALRGRRLERLVRLQRRARWLGEARSGCYRPLQRNSQQMNADTRTHRQRAQDIAAIVDTLQSDFPDLDGPLQRILGALQVD